MAIFDSTVPVDGAQAVYMSGRAGELTSTELERSIEVFGRLSEADVGRRWGLEDVQPPSLFRLNRVAVGALPVRVMIVRARSFSRSRVTLLLLSGSPYGRYESRSEGTSCASSQLVRVISGDRAPVDDPLERPARLCWRLVERAASRARALGQDDYRHAIQRECGEDAPLVRRLSLVERGPALTRCPGMSSVGERRLVGPVVGG